MKRVCLLTFLIVAFLLTYAQKPFRPMQTYQPDSRLAVFSTQKKAPEGFTVIEEQPEDELRIYSRSGSIVKEIINDDDVYEIVTGTQDGTVNIVFAKDGSVYFQRPVSESYYEG